MLDMMHNVHRGAKLCSTIGRCFDRHRDRQPMVVLLAWARTRGESPGGARTTRPKHNKFCRHWPTEKGGKSNECERKKSIPQSLRVFTGGGRAAEPWAVFFHVKVFGKRPAFVCLEVRFSGALIHVRLWRTHKSARVV